MFLLKPLLSRCAGGPGQLCSPRLSCASAYCTTRRARSRVRRGGFEKIQRDTVWRRRRGIAAANSRATAGLNLPKRQLSLLCNLTRTCLTWAWVSAPACPTALNQLHIRQRLLCFVCVIYHRYNHVVLGSKTGQWRKILHLCEMSVVCIYVAIQISRSWSRCLPVYWRWSLKSTCVALFQIKVVFRVSLAWEQGTSFILIAWAICTAHFRIRHMTTHSFLVGAEDHCLCGNSRVFEFTEGLLELPRVTIFALFVFLEK